MTTLWIINLVSMWILVGILTYFVFKVSSSEGSLLIKIILKVLSWIVMVQLVLVEILKQKLHPEE